MPTQSQLPAMLAAESSVPDDTLQQIECSDGLALLQNRHRVTHLLFQVSDVFVILGRRRSGFEWDDF